MDLTTVARLARRINPKVTTLGDDDTFLGQVIADVSASVEAYLDRQVTSATTTEYFDVDVGQTVFRLRAFPVTSVTSVHFDVDQSFPTSTKIDAEDFFNPALDESGVLALKYAPGCGRRSLKVVYVGGMAANAAAFVAAYPALAAAVDTQCAWVYLRRKGVGVQSRSGDKGSEQIEKSMPFLPDVLATLDMYRRWSVA